MANKKISELSVAGALTGTESVEVVQGGTNVKTTVQDIADLTNGISDGDKGDITVSAGGTVWSIDAATVGITELSATGTPDNTKFLRGDNTWAAPTGSGTVNIGTQYRIAYYAATGTAVSEASAITAARALKSDANGVPTHFDTATEPSLTELSYVKGTTSNIENRILYLPSIVGYLGSAGSDASLVTATQVDRIPTTSMSVGQRISAIVTISGTQRRLYTAELVVPADATANIEVSPSVIRPNDFNSGTNNKVWREIKNSGIIDVSNYGVLPDASVFVSDQIAAIITAASTGDTLIFPPGAYKIYAINVSKQLHFVGFGAKFVFSTVNTNHFTINVDLTTVKGFTFVGQGRAHATYPLQGAIKITNCSNVQISDCIFDTMPYYCILTNTTHISDTSSDFGGINIVNCTMMRSKYGFYAETRGEYVNIVGCSIVDNDIGLHIGAGNINVMGCNILDSATVAIDLVTDINDAHGVITGNQINHNTLSFRGDLIENGEFIHNNNIYYGDMEFSDCVGIHFKGNTIEGLEMKFDNCTGCVVENSTIPGIGGTVTLTTNWNSNQSDVFAYNNKNLDNKLVPGFNQSPLLSLYQHTSTAAVNYVVGKVRLLESEAMVVKGFVLGVRVDTSPNDYTEAYYRTFETLCRRQAAGNIVKVGENLGTAITDGAFGGTFVTQVNTTDQTLEIQVQPDADDTLWTVQFEYTKSSLTPGLLI